MWFPGKDFVGTVLTSLGMSYLYNGSLQSSAECCFHIVSFFIKVDISFGFLSVSKNR